MRQRDPHEADVILNKIHFPHSHASLAFLGGRAAETFFASGMLNVAARGAMTLTHAESAEFCVSC
jgi:hypothetical protein